MPYLPFLQQLGIVIEPFGEHQLRITAVPIHVKDISFNEIISMAAATIAEYGANLPMKYKKNFIMRYVLKWHARQQ